MSSGYPERQARSQKDWTATRILLAQALVIGAAASLGLLLTTGVNPRSVGFGVFALAAAVVLLFLCRFRPEQRGLPRSERLSGRAHSSLSGQHSRPGGQAPATS